MGLEFDTAGATVNLLFSRVSCRNGNADLFEVPDVATIP
jgi:hypothetical protein